MKDSSKLCTPGGDQLMVENAMHVQILSAVCLEELSQTHERSGMLKLGVIVPT
jgi:hypothetical protein